MVRAEIQLFMMNHPGELGKLAHLFGKEGININYVHGSVAGPDAECLFVFCPEDIALAAKIFPE